MIELVNEAAGMVGGIVELARQLGIKHNSIYCWQKIPPRHVLKFEAITGVSRHKIRPDIFGKAPEARQ